MRASTTTASPIAGDGRTPRVFAQGGLHGAPPYTLPALSGLLAHGCDGLAVDVAATRDGVLVAADDALIRASGLPAERVRDIDWADLAAVDFGAAFGFGDAPAKLMPLSELVTALGDDIYLALCFPAEVDLGLVDAVERCLMRWTRVLLIAPSVGTVADLSQAAPGALRLVAAQPWAPPADTAVVDGYAMDVRSFRQAGALPDDKIRVGLGCNTTMAAAEAWRLRLDIVFSERPAWLAKSFAQRAARERAREAASGVEPWTGTTASDRKPDPTRARSIGTRESGST